MKTRTTGGSVDQQVARIEVACRRMQEQDLEAAHWLSQSHGAAGLSVRRRVHFHARGEDYLPQPSALMRS
jgi:hypothetical protein